MNLRRHLARLQNMRGYRAEIEVQSSASRVEMTRAVPSIIGLKNIGSVTWHADGWYPVRLSYRWRRGAAVIEGTRFSLPADVHPGESAIIDCGPLAPAEAGEYVLEFDVVREHVGWFGDHGSAPAQVERSVRDYDYHDTYRQADLQKDYWTIVGPSSREQYEHLGRQKRDTLIGLGLTPRSHVLDVGCGTGQLAEALLEYLADEGFYLGTDIAAEAIAFCQAKFHRPNFLFRQNDMTGVEVDGHRFDIVFLSSVFTHMYPPEINAMLLDLRRVLTPGGLIMADVFVSPHARPVFGSRSKVEINEAHLMELFRSTGLRYELQGCIVQPAGGKRLGFIFRN